MTWPAPQPLGVTASPHALPGMVVGAVVVRPRLDPTDPSEDTPDQRLEVPLGVVTVSTSGALPGEVCR
ncbi:MAG: hypothetical protein ACI8RZ_004802 [Myxococcota bacterium]|jgi:hypothetical protein